MQTNADRSKEYVAVEKEYVAVEKEIQKHPHRGSLGGRERTRREGESRRQVEKEVKKEYVVIDKEIKTSLCCVIVGMKHHKVQINTGY